MLLLNNTDVEELLDMKTCLEALEVGYKDLVAGNAVHRPRIDVWAPCDRQDGLLPLGKYGRRMPDLRSFRNSDEIRHRLLA